MTDRQKILIVDDEPDFAREFSDTLSGDGYDVCESADVETAVDLIRRDNIAAIIAGAQMQGSDGRRLSEHVAENHPTVPVILLSACTAGEQTLANMSSDVFCYFKRPPDYLCLKGVLDRAVEQRLIKEELETLKKRLAGVDKRYRLIGNSAAMLGIFDLIEVVKDSDKTVLLCGETGTGKELIARTINYAGGKGGPFISFNCSAMPKELIESELFRREIGVLPGAHSQRTGKFDEPLSGTLFLEEIGDLELSLQARLFSFIRERELQRTESGDNGKADFRLISSTKRDLSKEVRNGNFREDLFCRINQVEISVPPLRERKDDILLLFSFFMNEFCAKEKKSLSISEKVIKTFEQYSWPGNVRQLRNVAERAVIIATGDKITLKELPEEILTCKQATTNNNSLKTLKELEVEALQGALQVCNGNKSMASRILGISRKAMYRLLREGQS
jgi:DNA-binding NtrC family response regulator